MNPDRFAEIERVCQAALDQPSDRRAGFLEAACQGDAELRAEVEALLAGTSRAASLLEVPPSAGRRFAAFEADSPAAVAASFAPGARISHYLVERRLGAGGMGEVFLARDLALGRPAALKVLALDAPSTLRDRLLREAEMSARLQHPGIATFFDAGVEGDRAFIAMEYVEGVTLRARLQQRGPLAPSDAISVAMALLEALVHAHAAGLFHRDVKPENIIIRTDGAPKLVDFGLASVLAAADDETPITRLTRDGVVVGTIGYMAPEQLRGEPADERADIFAVGAVLFEALTGAPAIPGHSPLERLAATLSWQSDTLPSIAAAPALARIVKKALAAQPARRHATAAEFLRDLQAVSEAPLQPVLPNTIAVVDFENLSRSPDDDWLGSGIAETLSADLARVPALDVLPRDRIVKARLTRLAAGDADPIAVAQDLGCRLAVSGSFQKARKRVRVTSRLAEVATGRVLWTDRMDGTVEDVFALEDRLSAAVAGAINVVLPAASNAARPRASGFECYARGRRVLHRLDKGAFEQARELFEQAIRLDAAYAPPYAGLAAMFGMRFHFTVAAGDLAQAVALARHAIEIDAQLADAHIWLGYALWRQGRALEALQEEARACALDARAGFARYFTGCILENLGRFSEATGPLQQAVALEDEVGMFWMVLGMNHLDRDCLDEAAWCFEQVKRLGAAVADPNVGAAGLLAEVLRRKGDLHSARAECLDALACIERADQIWRDSARGGVLLVLGRCALAQGDNAAAEVACGQVLAQIRGRPRFLGAGHVLVQALADRVRAGGRPDLLEEAERTYRTRGSMDFGFGHLAEDGETRIELALACAAVGRLDAARAWADEARAGGCSGLRLSEVEQAIAAATDVTS